MFDVPQLDFKVVRVQYQDTIHDDGREVKHAFIPGLEPGDAEIFGDILSVLEAYAVNPHKSLADELIAILNRPRA